MIKEMVAFIFRGRVCYLLDVDGDVTKTIAYKTPFGDFRAKRWWPLDIKSVTLGDNGEVINGTYVKRWTWADGTKILPPAKS